MKQQLGQEAIYDARQLGVPRMLVLGLQHLCAMFGATVVVPIIISGAYGPVWCAVPGFSRPKNTIPVLR